MSAAVLQGTGYGNTPGTVGPAPAPADATYVVMSPNAALTNERILTGTANRVTVTDGGPGGAVTLSAPQDLNTTANFQVGTLGVGVAPPVGAFIVQSGVITASAVGVGFTTNINNATDSAIALQVNAGQDTIPRTAGSVGAIVAQTTSLLGDANLVQYIDFRAASPVNGGGAGVEHIAIQVQSGHDVMLDVANVASGEAVVRIAANVANGFQIADASGNSYFQITTTTPATSFAVDLTADTLRFNGTFIDTQAQNSAWRLRDNQGSSFDFRAGASTIMLAFDTRNAAEVITAQRHFALGVGTGINIQTLAAGKTISLTEAQFQRLDCDGVDRNVLMPPEGEGLWYWIANFSAGAENLTILDDTGLITIAILNQNEAAFFVSTSSAWQHAGIMSIFQS